MPASPITERADGAPVAARILIATAVVAAGAVTIPGFPVLLAEPELITFSVVLAVAHAAPFVVAALVARRTRTRLAVAAALAALVAEAGLMAWAFSVLDDDAQGGLVYIFITPLASAAIAAAAALASVVHRR